MSQDDVPMPAMPLSKLSFITANVAFALFGALAAGEEGCKANVKG
jgi:hypothetical protein